MATPFQITVDCVDWWMVMADPEGNEFCVT